MPHKATLRRKVYGMLFLVLSRRYDADGNRQKAAQDTRIGAAWHKGGNVLGKPLRQGRQGNKGQRNNDKKHQTETFVIIFVKMLSILKQMLYLCDVVYDTTKGL